MNSPCFLFNFNSQDDLFWNDSFRDFIVGTIDVEAFSRDFMVVYDAIFYVQLFFTDTNSVLRFLLWQDDQMTCAIQWHKPNSGSQIQQSLLEGKLFGRSRSSHPAILYWYIQRETQINQMNLGALLYFQARYFDVGSLSTSCVNTAAELLADWTIATVSWSISKKIPMKLFPVDWHSHSMLLR